MSTQVVRVQGYSKGSLTAIGKECDRTPDDGVQFRNTDIDGERTHLNVSLKDGSPYGFYAEWADTKTALNAQYKDTKTSTAFEGMLITADRAFFEKMGYVEGQPMTEEMERFFKDSYKWALGQIGYKGTDRNIISAKVHLDEKTPHLHIYYLPVTDKWREKVYAKGEDGKILRSDKGTPIQAKDEKGKTMYREVEDQTAPKLSKTEFWQQRGGQFSYRQMQDSYQEQVGKQYNLDRGEIGSDRKHKTKYQYEHEKLTEETQQLTEKITPLREMKVETDKVERPGKELPLGIVAIKKKDLLTLREQANAYVVNRDEVLSVRDRLAEVGKREREVAGKEAWLNSRLREVNDQYARQFNLNKTLERTEAELKEVKQELTKVQRENTTLKGRISELERTFEQRVSEATEKLQETIDGLRTQVREAYESLRNVVQAVGLLRYDKKGSKYRCEDLTPAQERIIDGVAEYGAYWARAEGHEDLAEDMEKRIGLSKGLEKLIEPKVQEQGRGRGD